MTAQLSPAARWIDLGQRIGAVVDVAGAALPAGEIMTWARDHLDPARRPVFVHVVDEPVRNDAGKTSRKAYARRFAAGEGAVSEPGDSRPSRRG